ncbi:GAF and ANTAR domain-containing protein [Blastococcus sp. URHD0036]|uniref:GAF domain-containing protein n=1 Tax=Blastococcus sp. URHD0036 TaxID=1380356 RepID=UPI001E3B8AE8|nr:GAF and ANTAR domain-containing protein [Blastococcus sp. URHD0036]
MDPRTEDPPAVIVQALDELARVTLRDSSVSSLLQKVADVTRQVMPGRPEASVSLLVDDRPSTLAYSGQLAINCDESQYGHGYGPCLHAAATGELTWVPDTRVETRWPDYMRSAADYGALASLSVPLPINEGVRGALNIYAREADAFDDMSTAVAARLAPYAGVAAANMLDYQNARDMAENLQSALESRATIDQAKGMLMERFTLSPTWPSRCWPASR